MSGMWRQRQRREHLLACLAPTARGLVVNRSPRPCPAAHSGLASACVPTDDGAATRLADPAANSKAARSTGSAFLPAASESTPHLADHVSDFALRQLPIATMPEDSYCSATAVQEEIYATWLHGETQSQARSRSLAVSVVCNRS